MRIVEDFLDVLEMDDADEFLLVVDDGEVVEPALLDKVENLIEIRIGGDALDAAAHDVAHQKRRAVLAAWPLTKADRLQKGLPTQGEYGSARSGHRARSTEQRDGLDLARSLDGRFGQERAADLEDDHGAQDDRYKSLRPVVLPIRVNKFRKPDDNCCLAQHCRSEYWVQVVGVFYPSQADVYAKDFAEDPADDVGEPDILQRRQVDHMEFVSGDDKEADQDRLAHVLQAGVEAAWVDGDIRKGCAHEECREEEVVGKIKMRKKPALACAGQ